MRNAHFGQVGQLRSETSQSTVLDFAASSTDMAQKLNRLPAADKPVPIYSRYRRYALVDMSSRLSQTYPQVNAYLELVWRTEIASTWLCTV